MYCEVIVFNVSDFVIMSCTVLQHTVVTDKLSFHSVDLQHEHLLLAPRSKATIIMTFPVCLILCIWTNLL